MKLSDYISNQLIISQKQIRKNKKYSQAYIRERTYNPIKISKNNPFNSFAALKNEENLLNDENKLFYRLYTKTKKLYPTKINETFKGLITQYEKNNYIIPDFSDNNNLFNQNPLLLSGTELEQFYRSLNMKKLIKRKQKHINFIKKEMIMLENINYTRSNNRYNKGDKNIYNSKEEKNIKQETDYHADNIYDKIKEEKKRIKNKKLYIKRIKQKALAKSNNNINIEVIDNNFIKTKNNENKSNGFDKLKNLNSISPIRKGANQTIKNYTSKDTISLKNSDTNSTNYKHNTLNYLRKFTTSETINNSHNKRIRLRLLREEENKKILKEIEETEKTLNNKDFMERNLIIRDYNNKKSSTKNVRENTDPNNNNYNTIFGKLFQNLKFFDKKKRNPTNRVKGPLFLNLFGQKAIKQSIIRKLTKEKDQSKLLDSYMKLDMNIFEHNEIEKLMKIYYQKMLGYSPESIKKIIDMELGDELICDLIDKYIKKSKGKAFKYSTNTQVNKSLDKANDEIKALKNRFLVGKIESID